jgi:hypothetical protein
VNPEKASTDSFRGIFFVLFRGLSTNHRRRFRRSGARGKLADEESRQNLGSETTGKSLLRESG